MAHDPLHVAVIGGGLCGLSLAIALTKRSIPHIIYEARGSFTEIGAGINLGPNTIEAFNLIDPEIKNAIFSFATRNPGRQKDVWMNIRLGAPTKNYADAELIEQIVSIHAGTGNMTVSRNELLQFLAQRTKPENARFNKKLADLEQFDDHVSMIFEDGTTDTASVVVACDGAHSTARRLLLGADNPATNAKFSHTGGYRAVFPIDEFEKLVGKEQASVSTCRLGPEGYVITYPIDGGQRVNVGLWPWKPGDWSEESWVVPGRKNQMLEDFKAWGPTVHKIMNAMDDETAFWATFHHIVPPDSYWKKRVCIIGDAAHAMSPHQGQGAAQSMEDACVMAEVLHAASRLERGNDGDVIAAALASYEAIRRPRFEKAVTTSIDMFSLWTSVWREDLSEGAVEEFKKEANRRVRWAWEANISEQCKSVRAKLSSVLAHGGGGLGQDEAARPKLA